LETETVVGSSGISLSGGQKQRVALARALYAKKELVIIDDGISGVDAETEEAIFRKLFSENGLLGKLQTTVILVTNAIDRLRYADHIMCLDANGHITEQGNLISCAMQVAISRVSLLIRHQNSRQAMLQS
jgi:ATP-binding cassette subfamily C (CFTR/MRP) protein 1